MECVKEIYFAGGCFWGVQAYFDKIVGVVDTKVGYANGNTINPTYEDVCTGTTGYVEAVRVLYEAKTITLGELLEKFFKIIDPTSLNRQGNDIGSQYRTGIYFLDSSEQLFIDKYISKIIKNYRSEIVTERLLLKNFVVAEEYHQKYLEKNPQGYCHIDLKLALDEKANMRGKVKYTRPSQQNIREKLTDIAYAVTQNNSTEPPFSSSLVKNMAKGLYVDVVTGEPLFASQDKFDSGCGWLSFSKPLDKDFLKEQIDTSLDLVRVEVRSRIADSHLGHVFGDGPIQTGGLRYCINGAALEFIPYELLEDKGYGHLKKIFKE